MFPLTRVPFWVPIFDPQPFLFAPWKQMDNIPRIHRFPFKTRDIFFKKNGILKQTDANQVRTWSAQNHVESCYGEGTHFWLGPSLAFLVQKPLMGLLLSRHGDCQTTSVFTVQDGARRTRVPVRPRLPPAQTG